MIESCSPSPATSTSEASADSTLHAKPLRSGLASDASGESTVVVTASRPVDSSNRASHRRPGLRMRQQQRAGLVHRQAQILDVVDGQVAARAEAGGGQPQGGDVGAVGGDPDLDDVAVGPVIG